MAVPTVAACKKVYGSHISLIGAPRCSNGWIYIWSLSTTHEAAIFHSSLTVLFFHSECSLALPLSWNIKIPHSTWTSAPTHTGIRLKITVTRPCFKLVTAGPFLAESTFSLKVVLRRHSGHESLLAVVNRACSGPYGLKDSFYSMQ